MLRPALQDRIREGQKVDMQVCRLRRKIEAGKRPDFSITDDGIIRYKGRLCVPFDKAMKVDILEKAHTT